MGPGPALPAPIKLPCLPAAWGVPGGRAAAGCHSSWGHEGFGGGRGFLLPAPCTHSRGLLEAPGCWWGSQPGCWPWTAPARLPTPLGGPSSLLRPGCRQLLAGVFRYWSCPICVPNVPGGGWPPPLAAVARFLPRVPAKPLHGAGIGVGARSTHRPRGVPRVGGTPPGTWPGMLGGQAGPG